MFSFDQHQGLSTKKNVDAMSLNVVRPTARDELGETFVDSWTLAMRNQPEICGNMQKSAGVLKRWQRQMQQRIYLVQERY